MVRRHALLFVILCAGELACQTPRSIEPFSTALLPKLRPPSEALKLASETSDHARAFEIAWLQGNDRAVARGRLEQGLQHTPHNPALLLRRALLNLAELRESKAQADLLSIIQHTPMSPQCEVALIILLDRNIERADRKRRALDALDASGLLKEAAVRPRLVALASALSHQLRPSLETLRRGGWLTNFQSFGPLAPMDDLELDALSAAQDARRAVSTWRKPQTRMLEKSARRLKVTTGDIGGIYRLSTCFSLSSSETLVLESHLQSATDVRLNHFLIQQRRLNKQRDGRLHRTQLKLSKGRHCLHVTTASYSVQRPSFSLLSNDGRAVITEATDGSKERPKVLPLERSEDSADAFVARLLESEGRALFGRLLGGVLALSSWQQNLDQAQALLEPLGPIAETSAVVQAAWARLQISERLPDSLSQSSLKQAVALDPNYPSALLALARAVAQDAPEEALQLLARAQKAAPDSADVHAMLFRVLKQRGFDAEAARHLEAAFALEAERQLFLDGMRFYRGQDKIAQARAVEAAAAKLFPKDAKEQADRALDEGRPADAIQLLREAAKQNDDGAGYLARASELALALNQTKEAIQLAKEATDRDPLNSIAIGRLFLAQLASGDLKSAEASLQTLRRFGESTLHQEALFSNLSQTPLNPPLETSWAKSTLAFDPLPLIAPMANSKLPRGIDPAERWSRDKSVLLLDRVVDRVLPDGRALSYRHSINRLQTKEATDQAGELNLPPDALALQLRTLKPNGKTIEVDRHEGKDDLSFSGLAPGDAVERGWLTLDEPATPYGGYVRRFFFKSTSPIVRSELMVIVPKGTPLWSKSYHGAPSATVHHEGGFTYYLWRADNISGFTPEPAATSSEEYLPFVAVSVGLDHTETLLTNTMILHRQAQSSWNIRHQAQRLTEGLDSQDKKIDRLFFWITDEIGLGGPKEPGKVLYTKRGERSGLFVAMLRALGIEAELALGRSHTDPLLAEEYPHSGRFSLPLVKLPDRWAHLDSTSPWIGKLPPYLRNGQYLLPESREAIRAHPFLPQDVDTWVIESTADLAIDLQGTAKGALSITLPGTYGSEFRTFLEQARKEEIDRLFQARIAAIIPGAKLDNFSADKTAGGITFELEVTIEHFMIREGAHLIAENLFNTPLGMNTLGLPGFAAYIQVPKRKTPLLMQELKERMTINLSLPEGAQKPLEHPKSFRRLGRHTGFTQAFFWDPQAKKIKMVREDEMRAARLLPKTYPAFREAMQEVLQKMRNRLVFKLDLPKEHAKKTP